MSFIETYLEKSFIERMHIFRMAPWLAIIATLILMVSSYTISTNFQPIITHFEIYWFFSNLAQGKIKQKSCKNCFKYKSYRKSRHTKEIRESARALWREPHSNYYWAGPRQRRLSVSLPGQQLHDRSRPTADCKQHNIQLNISQYFVQRTLRSSLY